MKPRRLQKVCVALQAAGVAASMLTPNVTLASDEVYYNDEREEGWFWYNDYLKKLEEEQAAEKPTPVIQTAEERKSPSSDKRAFSVEWLQEKIPQQLEVAIDDPSDVNVRAYAYLQRAAFDKAEGFARRFQEVVLTDPVLDESNRVPVATFARAGFSRIKADERDRILAWLAKRIGFFYFHDATCHFCQLQAPALRRFADKYGFRFINIKMRDEGGDIELPGKTLPNAGHAKKFKVRQVPALVIVAGADKVAVVSENLLSFDEIQSRTIITARQLEILTEEDERRLAPRTTLDYVSSNIEGEISEDDPQTWINRIRADLGLEEMR